MRIILVPVADRPECVRALRTAFDLGQQLGANLFGCHIRPHQKSAIALPAEFAMLADSEAVWESAKHGRKTQMSSASAEALFGKIAHRHDYSLIKRPGATPGAVWLEKVGSPDRVMANLGPVSDLIVVSRPAPKNGNIARLFLLAALLNSSRPVLILPQAGTSSIGKRISIAWNQSAEAARAVTAALPLLRQADQVNIITCGIENGVGPKSVQLANYLRFWGIKANRVKARGDDPAKALVKAYKDTKSDLLVMGAYSRSRLRQRIFGGITEFMLHQAKIPVFMLHT